MNTAEPGGVEQCIDSPGLLVYSYYAFLSFAFGCVPSSVYSVLIPLTPPTRIVPNFLLQSKVAEPYLEL